VTLAVHNNALGLSQEVCVDLSPDHVHFTRATVTEATELPGSVGAPHEAAFREIFLTHIVHSNGHKIVVFDSIDFTPELEFLELKFLLERV